MVSDRGVNTFSPEGRLFQVEYAIEAIKLGSTTIAATTKDGVILGVERRSQSKLLEASSIEKIMEIDSHVGCAVSGLVADSRTMVEHARVVGQNHRFTFDEPIKTESVTQAVCDLALRFGESTHDEDAMMVSPFDSPYQGAGHGLLVSLFSSQDVTNMDLNCEVTPQLSFHADPSGTFMRYDAKAIGSGSEGAQTELQERWHKSMTLQEAKLLVLQVLRHVMEEKLDEHNVQLAQVTPSGGFHILTNSELKESISQMPVENNPTHPSAAGTQAAPTA
ncbi:hypothetical protein PtB15_18B158 [Puccinia triticina]|nr:hypothetical protein PtB15_18B158 [Puccinia triticina]